jgi:hypothetical protein
MIGIIHLLNNTSIFYMDETEVTNFVPRVFRFKNVFPPTEDNYRHIYEGASPIPWYGEIVR